MLLAGCNSIGRADRITEGVWDQQDKPGTEWEFPGKAWSAWKERHQVLMIHGPSAKSNTYGPGLVYLRGATSKYLAPELAPNVDQRDWT